MGIKLSRQKREFLFWHSYQGVKPHRRIKESHSEFSCSKSLKRKLFYKLRRCNQRSFVFDKVDTYPPKLGGASRCTPLEKCGNLIRLVKTQTHTSQLVLRWCKEDRGQLVHFTADCCKSWLHYLQVVIDPSGASLSLQLQAPVFVETEDRQ